MVLCMCRVIISIYILYLLQIIKVENVRRLQAKSIGQVSICPKQSRANQQLIPLKCTKKEGFPLRWYKQRENKIIQISNIHRQTERVQMLKHKLLQQKIFTLCQFISQGIDSRKTNQLIAKACQLGLPLSPTFTKQRYIYNIALAAITTIIEINEGFVLAAIFLKDVCVGKSYWDILHFLYELKDQILGALSGADQVMQRIQVFNIAVCHDLNAKYQCHCTLRNISHFYLAPNKKIPKVLPVELSIPKSQLRVDSNKNGTNKNQCIEIQDRGVDIISLIQNQNKRETSEIIKYQSVNHYIYLDAQFVQLSQNSCSIVEDSYQSVIEIDNKIIESSSKKQFILRTAKKSVMQINSRNQNRFSCLSDRRLNQVGYNAVNVQQSGDQSFSVSELSQNCERSLDKSKKIDESQVQPINMDQYYQFLEQKHEKSNIKPPQKIMETQKHRLERCELCLQLYHPLCQADQIFICNKCYLKQNSISYRVISNLFAGYIHCSSYLTLINFQCPNVTSAKSMYSDSFIVQIRFQYFKPPKSQQQNRFDNIKRLQESGRKKEKKKKSSHNNVAFYLNYQPLSIKNVGENFQIHSVKIPLKFLEERNVLVIQKIKVQPSKKIKSLPIEQQSLMLLGIYQVVPRSRRKEPIYNSITTLSSKTNYLFYQSVLKRNNQTYMKVSTLSGVSNMIMSCPVRSYQCLHATCFDFSQIKFSQSSSNRRIKKYYRKSITVNDKNRGFRSQSFQQIEQRPLPSPRIKRSRKIQCPICGVEMKGLYLDTLMLQKIEQKDKRNDNFLEIFNNQILDEVPLHKQNLLNEQKQREKVSQTPKMIQIIQENSSSEILNPRPTIHFSDSDLSFESIEVIEKMIKKTTGVSKAHYYKSQNKFEAQEQKAEMMIQVEKSRQHHIQYIQDSVEIVQNSRSIQDFYIPIESVEDTNSL